MHPLIAVRSGEIFAVWEDEREGASNIYFSKSIRRNDSKTRFLFQLPAILLLVLVVFAGFFGIQNSNKNLATISIWVVWWSLLIISLALFGRIWCLMCPFGAIGDWVQRRTFYKTLVMIRPWAGFARDLMIYTGASYDSIRFILFITAAVFPVLIYSIAIAIAITISKLFDQKIIFKDLITSYAYSIIPLGLMMHLSNNIRHLLEEGRWIIPVLSDPFGFGWNLFGTSGYNCAYILY